MGMEPAGLVEIAPLGLIAAFAGGAFLALAGPRLLPEREVAGVRSLERERSYLAQVVIPDASPLMGKRPDET